MSEYIVIEGDEINDLKYAYYNGYFVDHKPQSTWEESRKRLVLLTKNVHTYELPINASIGNRILWLAGLFDSNGFYTNHSVIVISNHKDFLIKVIKLSNTLGINPYLMNNQTYFYGLTFSSLDIEILYNELGLKTKVLQIL
jgi:hypothetical protein